VRFSGLVQFGEYFQVLGRRGGVGVVGRYRRRVLGLGGKMRRRVLGLGGKMRRRVLGLGGKMRRRVLGLGGKMRRGEGRRDWVSGHEGKHLRQASSAGFDWFRVISGLKKAAP
jgi:hypothetical protein